MFRAAANGLAARACPALYALVGEPCERDASIAANKNPIHGVS